MNVRFWGVRGSVPVSGPEFLRTGGNTTCVELEHEGEMLILDGGTGLQALAQARGPGPMRATVLFTHVHWDHIQGVPYFTPAFHPESRLSFVGASRASGTVRDALMAQMSPPRFPVTLDVFNAAIHFRDLRSRQVLDVGPFRVTPCDLAHPDGIFAYRVEAGGRAVVFATDVEHGDDLDERLVRLAEGADVLVHDAQYTEAEYRGSPGPPRRGWGHSTWADAARVADRAGVDRLVLFHHDPTRTDAGVDRFERDARSVFGRTVAAREHAPLVA